MLPSQKLYSENEDVGLKWRVMVPCFKCGTKNEDSAEYCVKCEAKLEVKCPACKQLIKMGAVKCKYCKINLAGCEPDHGGTCPYCKEAIDPEAVRCHHCLTNLTTALLSDALLQESPGSYLTIEGSCPGSVVPVAALNASFQARLISGGPSGPAGGGLGFGRTRCFWIYIPVCDVIEEQSPVAGFLPKRYENCRWEKVKICVWSPV